MPYVASDGTVGGQRKWSMNYFMEMFWGPINFIVLFFQTLINPKLTSRGDGYESSYRSSGSGSNPPGPPPRRMGRLHRAGGANPPPFAGGG